MVKRLKTLVMATHNKGKVEELSELLKDVCDKVVSASDMKLSEPEETEDSFEGNALIKARAAYKETGYPALADDSGLCVNALNGAPGVYSARWAGPEKNFETAMNFLDTKLAGMTDRSAHFKTVLAYIDEKGAAHIFEGQVDGNLIWPPSGEKGFGYDPIFVPEGERRTFAEMERHEKQAMSHRGKALLKFLDFLRDG